MGRIRSVVRGVFVHAPTKRANCRLLGITHATSQNTRQFFIHWCRHHAPLLCRSDGPRSAF